MYINVFLNLNVVKIENALNFDSSIFARIFFHANGLKSPRHYLGLRDVNFKFFCEHEKRAKFRREYFREFFYMLTG